MLCEIDVFNASINTELFFFALMAEKSKVEFIYIYGIPSHSTKYNFNYHSMQCTKTINS